MGREEAGERIRALGGTFQSSVGKDTDYLVVGANVGASKLAKADKFGTKQITEEDLIEYAEMSQLTDVQQKHIDATAAFIKEKFINEGKWS